MRPRADYLEGLVDLAAHPSRNVRRAVFRQSLASLALVDALDGPGPLDSLNPEALLRSIQIAMADGLLDDLSWLAPAAAGVALYELAGALPLGVERRDLGRRVLGQLYAGNASTFVAIATRMAIGTARGLSGAGIHARVALSLFLPPGSDIPIDPLALAITSRRELARDWISAASTGSLPDRRLAARLLERACREATRRASQGDDLAIRLFRNVGEQRRKSHDVTTDALSFAWKKLLADRETLVWRHVAAARGLLAGVLPDIADDLRDMLAPDLSSTEWRRGATSVVASIAVDPEPGLQRAMDLLHGPLLAKDPGIANAMIWGLTLAADAEPEAAEELLDAVVAAAPIACAEGVAHLRHQLGVLSATRGTFGARAAARCADALSSVLISREADDGLVAVARTIQNDLSGSGKGAELREAIDDAVCAFVDVGPRDAHARAVKALGLATEVVQSLDHLDVTDRRGPVSSLSRRAAAELIRNLDAVVLEPGTLRNLLLLDRRPSDDATGVAALDDMDEQLTAWLLRTEGSAPIRDAPPDSSQPSSKPNVATPAAAHVVLHQRNLRALLHLIDSESTDFSGEPDRKERVRTRWTKVCNSLFNRLNTERTSPLHRSVAATVARGLDALVRDGAADTADVFLYAAMHAVDPGDLEVLAEASMDPDIAQLLFAYARFVRSAEEKNPDSAGPASVHGTGVTQHIRTALARISALDTLITDMPAGASQRTELVRSMLARLARSLNAIQRARALSSLVSGRSGEASVLSVLGDAITRLAQLTTGARRRCGDNPTSGADSSAQPMSDPSSTNTIEPLRVTVEVAIQQPEDTMHNFQPAIHVATTATQRALPAAIADTIALVLPHIISLPVRHKDGDKTTALPDQPLPAWLPSRRTIGGFYVHRQLGGGSLGTVFVVTRAEDRHRPTAERFALKVPDYDETAARSVSEEDFIRQFREDAGALMDLPQHPNLPKFITFDPAARPKPILVMELIEGVACDKLIDARGLSMRRVIALLDGVLSGLAAMHALDIGHLDVKPTNVILRGSRDPVLVDFGLAGRHIRPGCATGGYGAPEIWGVLPEGVVPTPARADIYSFGCLAYEVFTAKTLFEGANDAALISAHVSHDGLPPPIKKLAGNPKTADIAAFLFACLRKNPRDRAAATSLRADLGRMGRRLSDMRWPLE